MTGAIAIDDDAIDTITESAADHIALAVQGMIGQTDGGLAGQHFGRHGPAYKALRAIVSDYLALEELHAGDDDPDNDATAGLDDMARDR